MATLQRTYNPENSNEYNLTASFKLVLSDAAGQVESEIDIRDLVLIQKYKTYRMLKDCSINHMGQWNSTEQKCYAFSYLSSVCYVLD